MQIKLFIPSFELEVLELHIIPKKEGEIVIIKTTGVLRYDTFMFALA